METLENDYSEHHFNGIVSDSRSIMQAAMHPNGVLPGNAQEQLAWPGTHSEWMLPCANDFSISSLDNYLATLVSSIEESARDTTTKVEHPAQDVDLATMTAGLDPAISSSMETTESNRAFSSASSSTCSSTYSSTCSSTGSSTGSLTGQEQYQNCLYQLSRLQRTLHRLQLASTENKCHDCPSEFFSSSSGINSAAVGEARIDKTLAATQAMVELLDQLCSIPFSTGSPRSSSDVWYSSIHGCPLSLSLLDSHSGSDPGLLSASPSVPVTLQQNGLDTAAILVVLTCYICLLHIYEIHITSLQQRLRQSTTDVAGLRSRGSSSASLFTTAQDSPPFFPAFNIGTFSFAASPDFNIHLLLYTITQMIERMQAAIQACLSSSRSSQVFSTGTVGEGAYGDSISQAQRQEIEVISACLHDPMASVVNTTLSEARRKETTVMGMLYPPKGNQG